MILKLLKWFFKPQKSSLITQKSESENTITDTMENYEEPVNYKTRETEIKTIIKNLLKEGKCIQADWDAGGDSTLCNVSIDNNYSYPYKNHDICETIRYWIIDTLELPNASEHYHKGQGIISLNEAEDIGITFTSKEHTYGDTVEETFVAEIEDNAKLRHYLHKYEITFAGNIDNQQNRDANIRIDTIFGEAPVISQDQLKTYEERIHELLSVYESQFNTIGENTQELTAVYLRGTLTVRPEVTFFIEKSYEVATYHTNEFVVLM